MEKLLVLREQIVKEIEGRRQLIKAGKYPNGKHIPVKVVELYGGEISGMQTLLDIVDKMLKK